MDTPTPLFTLKQLRGHRWCFLAASLILTGIARGADTPAPTAGSPPWLQAQLETQIQDTFEGVFRCGEIIFQPPQTIVLHEVVLEPRRPFGWAELALKPADEPREPWGGRLTIDQATLVLAEPPVQGQALHVTDLTLEHPQLIGAAPKSTTQEGSQGPRVETGVDQGKTMDADQSPAMAGRQLKVGFEHLSVAVQTLPPTVSFNLLRNFLPLDHLTIRGGRITDPAMDGNRTACGVDMQTVADPDGQWRFGLTLSSPGPEGETRVQTQGYCNPDQGTISMTGVKFFRVGADGKSSEIDMGRIRLKLLLEHGPADGGVPKPRVDTTEIDHLPSQYLAPDAGK